MNCLIGNNFVVHIRVVTMNGTGDLKTLTYIFGILKNKRGQCLVLNDNRFSFIFLNTNELESQDNTIKIRVYGKNDMTGGYPVTIFVQNCVVACSTKGDKKVNSLSKNTNSIDGKSREAIFFMKRIEGKTNHFKFESLLYPRWFLGFKSISGMWELDLIEEDTDESGSRSLKFEFTINPVQMLNRLIRSRH
uniref:Uncharacterized protein n=1 Tax=Esox lucius TaxID=8010 RepID=A0A3P8Y377_ESOLU